MNLRGNIRETGWICLLGKPIGVLAFCTLLGGLCFGSAGADEEREDKFVSELKDIRVDLQSGAFLGPLPFDTPFFIGGWVPHATRSVEVKAEELLGELIIFGEDARRIKAFEDWVLAFLDSTLAAERTPIRSAEVRRQMVDAFVRSPGSFV